MTLPPEAPSAPPPATRFMAAQTKLADVRLTLADATVDLVLADGQVGAQIGDWRVSSHFQAIFSTGSKQVCAHEGLIRARNAFGDDLAVAEIFRLPPSIADPIGFDRLCRALHLLNYYTQGSAESQLFVNLDGRFIERIERSKVGEMFAALRKMLDFKTAQIVLEVVESEIDDLARLQDVLSVYKSLGFGVAIDDFGAQSSNFDRLCQLEPDIVKIDRFFIEKAVSDRKLRKILPKMVEIVHEMEAQVVLEGVETLDQHLLALDCGADLVQGFLYSRPQVPLHRAPHSL